MAFGRKGHSGQTPASGSPVRGDSRSFGEAARKTSRPPTQTASADVRPQSSVQNALLIGASIAVLAGSLVVAAPIVVRSLEAKAPPPPLEQQLQGLNHSEVRRIIASQAFPDADGAAFLAALHTHFPGSHDQLIDRLATLALSGASREDLYSETLSWSGAFAIRNLTLISRSGPAGFDQVMDILISGQSLLGSTGETCTVGDLQRALETPDTIQAMGGYGSASYTFAMRANLALVTIAASGKGQPHPEAEFSAADRVALRNAVSPLVESPRHTERILGEADTEGRGPPDFGALAEIDLCQTDEGALERSKLMAADAKAKLMAFGADRYRASGARTLASLGPTSP